MPDTPETNPEAYRYIGERITLAKNQGNTDLVNALLDLWIDHRLMASDCDAEPWGFNPKRWADPKDLAAFKRMPHPGLSVLKR
jgi:hypothetical protein